MRLKPFFTYFGGKYRAAPKYPTPEHDVIVEPFAGSAGYAMRHPHHKVILNDLDEKVAGTWEYLINVSEDEILSLPIYDGTWATVDDLNLPPVVEALADHHRGIIVVSGTSCCALPCEAP